jgi:hypothetical protein
MKLIRRNNIIDTNEQKKGLTMQMDEDITFCVKFGVESSSSKHAQGGPGMLANRDIQKKSLVLLQKKAKIFPPAAGVLLRKMLVEPGGPRVCKFDNSQDKRGYPQYCLASQLNRRTKNLKDMTKKHIKN